MLPSCKGRRVLRAFLMIKTVITNSQLSKGIDPLQARFFGFESQHAYGIFHFATIFTPECPKYLQYQDSVCGSSRNVCLAHSFRPLVTGCGSVDWVVFSGSIKDLFSTATRPALPPYVVGNRAPHPKIIQSKREA